MKSAHVKNLWVLNVGVLFISTSGVLGRFITLPPPVTIWWRCLLGCLLLFAFCRIQKINLRFSSYRDLASFVISAIFLGAHWVTYFYALYYSNVALGMLSLFTYPVITALLEPLFFKTPLNKMHVFLGFVVLLGIYLLTPEFDLQNSHTKGIVFGLISSVFYALRNILSKKDTIHYDASMMMFYQLLIVSLLLWPVLFLFEFEISTNDWWGIAALSLITTAIGHTLFVRSFKSFNISTASIISSIQPVYGILLALLLLGEVPGGKTLIGGSLIILTVVIEGILSKK